MPQSSVHIPVSRHGKPQKHAHRRIRLLDFLADVVQRYRRYHRVHDRPGRCRARQPVDNRHFAEYVTLGQSRHDEFAPILVEGNFDHARIDDIGTIPRIALLEDILVRTERLIEVD